MMPYDGTSCCADLLLVYRDVTNILPNMLPRIPPYSYKEY